MFFLGSLSFQNFRVGSCTRIWVRPRSGRTFLFPDSTLGISRLNSTPNMRPRIMTRTPTERGAITACSMWIPPMTRRVFALHLTCPSTPHRDCNIMTQLHRSVELPLCRQNVCPPVFHFLAARTLVTHENMGVKSKDHLLRDTVLFRNLLIEAISVSNDG